MIYSQIQDSFPINDSLTWLLIGSFHDVMEPEWKFAYYVSITEV